MFVESCRDAASGLCRLPGSGPMSVFDEALPPKARALLFTRHCLPSNLLFPQFRGTNVDSSDNLP